MLAAIAAAVAGVAAVFVALVALAAQCDEVCAESTATTWAERKGAWQWTAQFAVAVASFALTVLAAGAALERSRRAVFIGGAALVAWLAWWLAFEPGLRVVV